MKAWQLSELGDPWDVLKLVDLEPPAPPEGLARIEVEGADVNFADILQCQGQYQVKLDPPFVPGMGAAGRVVASGPGCTLEVGQRVVGSTRGPWGAFGQHAFVAPEDVHPLPDAVSGVEAAGLHVTYGTAWFARTGEHQHALPRRQVAPLVQGEPGGAVGDVEAGRLHPRHGIGQGVHVLGGD
ncbi:MAG: alcohol dehydrogenase catalytic domain-containing protein, partial [Actinomycetota bacterium]